MKKTKVIKTNELEELLKAELPGVFEKYPRSAIDMVALRILIDKIKKIK